MKLSINQITEVLTELTGSKIVTLEAVTEPKLKKTGNPFTNVIKVAKVNGMLNVSYENSVNNQRARECESVDNLKHFEAAQAVWGTHVGGAVVEYKGSSYIQIKVERSLGYDYFDKVTGELLPKEEVNQFLPKRKKPARQETEKEIVLRRYKVGSIKSITMDKETLEVG